jgi:hypothetical protein
MILFFCADFIDDQSSIQQSETNSMKTDQYHLSETVFPQTVSIALEQLKQQLQQDYEQAYPDLREIIHLVLDEEETNAWELTSFPHLLLPDLVEAHVAKLNLRPADTKHADVLVPHNFTEIENHQPALALCG